MKIALLRVGADSGNLGFHSPLFKDGTFDFIPIDETFNDNCNNYDRKIDEKRTYSNTITRDKKYKFLIDYFPDESRKRKLANSIIHFDPEFETFTYGDPNKNKNGLSKLEIGDYLIFYSSLTPFPYGKMLETKLFVIGYFEISHVVKPSVQCQTIEEAININKELLQEFKNNFHVKHWNIFKRDVLCKKNMGLKLVKGTSKSKFLNKAYCI